MNAKEIVDLLAVRHSEDVFIPECKNGPTHAAGKGGMVRMDVWTMAKSWVNPCATCYEIKVSRSDFLQDKKWQRYLPYANCLYFVTPHKLIDVTEVPEQAGLVWVSQNGSRLFTKKKAPYRELDLPLDLLLYIIICRAKITRERLSDPEEKLDFWRKWLEKSKESTTLGYNVSHAIREKFEHVSNEMHSAQHRATRLEEVDKFLRDELGIDIQRGYNLTTVLRQIKEKIKTPDKEKLTRLMTDVDECLGDLRRYVSELE